MTSEPLTITSDSPLLRFVDIPWSTIAPGAREKKVTCGVHVLRLVEFFPPFREIEWCHKQHVGFVVSGRFSLQYQDSFVSFERGDGIAIPAGESTKHRAVVDENVTLFLVEPSA